MYQGVPMNRGHAGLRTSDGNVCYISQGGGTFVQKVSPAGGILWASPTSQDQYYALAESAAGDVYACGYTMRSYASKKYDMLLRKFGPKGDTLWTFVYGGKETEYALDMCATSDGGFLLSGIWSDQTQGISGILLLQLDANGDSVWSKRFQGLNYNITVNQVRSLKNGDILLSGDYTGLGQPRKAILRRLSSTGDPIWEYIDTGANSNGKASVEMADGSIVTCGTKNPNFQSNLWIQRLDKTGKKLWDRSYGTKDNLEFANDIQMNADGSMSLTGGIRVENFLEVILMHIDGEGNSIKDMRFGLKGTNAQGICLLKDLNDDNLILGQSNDKAFLVRSDSKGNFK